MVAAAGYSLITAAAMAARASPQAKETDMKTLFQRFAKDESGVTAIEYGLIAALIAVVIITAVTSVGTTLSGTFNTVAAKI
jgi:pilus assembly protein Flp/PilA